MRDNHKDTKIMFAELNKTQGKPVKVRALEEGYFQRRRKVGEVFMVPQFQVSAHWMEIIDAKKLAEEASRLDDMSGQIEELKQIKGIGTERAIQLVNAGVTGLKDIIELSRSNDGRITLSSVGGISAENLESIVRQCEALIKSK